MIEQYIYNLVTADATLQALLTDGASGYKVFPSVIPRGVNADKAMAFSVVTTFDAYPTIKSQNVQFNIFAAKHADTTAIAAALFGLFNEANNRANSNAGMEVVYSQRSSESDLGFDFDTKLYHREATYYFKIR